jgi:hypothetical protein
LWPGISFSCVPTRGLVRRIERAAVCRGVFCQHRATLAEISKKLSRVKTQQTKQI